MLIDSHCHLTDERLLPELDPVLERAGLAGVVHVVTIASDAADSERIVDLVRGRVGRTGPRLWGTVGIHPHEAAASADGDLDRVRDLAREPGIVAIGETGLDFHYDHSPRARQLRMFEAQIDLAAELGLPLVVHARSADEDTAAVLRSLPTGVRGVLHCFTGGPELFDAGLEAGWNVSFSGIASFKKFDAAALVARAPEDRLMVETDAPYLAPVPYRGKRNEPAFVAEVARAVASHRGEDPEALGRTTTANAVRFYALPERGSGSP